MVVLESGEEKTYTSQSLTPYQPNIFTDKFDMIFAAMSDELLLRDGIPIQVGLWVICMSRIVVDQFLKQL